MTGLQVTTTWRSPLASAFQVQILSLQGLRLGTCIASPHTYSVFVSPGPQRKQKEEIETELTMQEVWNKRENEGEARRRWRVACGADVALSEGQKEGRRVGWKCPGQSQVWQGCPGVLESKLPCWALPPAGSSQGPAWCTGSSRLQRAVGGTSGQLCTLRLDT